MTADWYNPVRACSAGADTDESTCAPEFAAACFADDKSWAMSDVADANVDVERDTTPEPTAALNAENCTLLWSYVRLAAEDKELVSTCNVAFTTWVCHATTVGLLDGPALLEMEANTESALSAAPVEPADATKLAGSGKLPVSKT